MKYQHRIGMNKWGHHVNVFSIFSILFIGCVEPYSPPDVGDGVSIVVVDGFINATEGSATVRLTKAVPLTAKDEYPAEKGADVTIRSETGDTFHLAEKDSGRYSVHGLTVDPSTKYQLIIRTAGNRDFISDYITVTQTPPIDSVTWRGEEDGVTFLVNTHDDTQRSRYYNWHYTETWEYHAPLPSFYTNVNGFVFVRKPQEMLYTCYSTVPSTKIVVGSTVRLSEDVVRDFPLTYIQSGSSRISIIYSILVRQRVIDKTEYEFLQDLQRVTESVGGLFDSQPYEILGNIHSTDPSVPVLGFFSAGFVQEERVFLRWQDLPDYLLKWHYQTCRQDTVCSILRPDLRCVIDLASLPDNSYLVADLNPQFPGYTVTSKSCADCRVQGGVLTKPDFWP